MPTLVAGLAVLALVLPALALTTARTLTGDSLPWVILRALTPMAIAPYALAAVILLAAQRAAPGAARPVALSALTGVASLLLLHVWWLAGPFLDHASGSPTDDAFVVMTANLHLGRADPQAVVDAVDRHDVDVLVLEEITPSAVAALDRAGLGRRLVHRVGAAQIDRDGIMLMSDLPMGPPTEIATSSPAFGVDVTTGRGPVRVLAVHPIAPNNGVAQWDEDLDTIVAAADASTGPTVVAGDFNATLDHPQLRTLMGAGYRDASSDAGPGWRPTWPSAREARVFGVRLPPLFALDHVFVRGPLEATEAVVVAVPGTDHRALVTRIAWTDGAD